MATTTEEKKYLINVESNLDEYAADVTKAAKEVEKLSIENIKLRGSSTASKEEIEKSNAALKAAQAEYNTAQRLLVSYQKGLASETNSRKELNEVVKLQQYALGKLGDGYIKDAQGILRVNPLYEEQTKKIRATKEAIILLDKAQLDGRSSVGLYSEAIQGALGNLDMMPGSLGRVASSAKQLSTAFKALLANPVALAIAAIVSVLGLLVKAFKGNDEASERFQGIMKGIRTAITEVLGRIVSLGKAIGSLFRGDFAQAAEYAKEAVTGFGQALKNAYGAGVEAQKLLNKIEDDEIKLIEIRAKRERDIADLKKKSRDAGEGSVKQAEYLRKAQELIVANMEDELSIQQDRVKVAEMILAATNKNQISDEQRRNLAEERAKLMQLETQALNEQGGLLKRLGTLEGKNASDKLKSMEELAKERQKAMKEEVELVLLEAKGDPEKMKQAIQFQYHEMAKQTDISETQRRILKIQYEEAIAKIDEEYNKKELEAVKQLAEDVAAFKAADDAAKFEYQRLQNENDLAALTQILDQEYQALLWSAEYEQLTYNQRILAEEQYNQAKKQLSQARMDQLDREKLMVADALGVMSNILGETTAAGKAFAVAEATINTWVAASKALKDPTMPSTIARIALMIAVIGMGLITVRKILAVKIPGKGGGGGSATASGGATAISSSIPAQRVFATSVGSSILTQPKLTQEQINALPNTLPTLTADDIANAVSKLPAPKVTVEDINARTAESRKVEVMGVI